MAYDTGTTHYYPILLTGSLFVTHLKLAWGLLHVNPYATGYHAVFAVRITFFR